MVKYIGIGIAFQPRTCIANSEGGTGTSFAAFVAYLGTAKPKYFFGEMVTRLGFG